MKSDRAAEIFITATPDQPQSASEQAQALFTPIAGLLHKRKARILHERIFATQDAFEAVLPIRAAAYGDLDDGVPPLMLQVPQGLSGPVAGIQVHAVSSDEQPRVVRSGGVPCGRTLDADGLGYTSFSGLMAPEAGPRTDQAQAIFRKAESLLREAGGSMMSVARTWLWLSDILAWYNDFNKVRNDFFVECGLLNPDRRERRLPASTGIGVGPTGRPLCALDVVALLGPRASVECFHAAGMQQSAYNYGSAFSRVARATTPAGKTVYVSGTAAIDETGKTCHVGDPKAQIAMTLANVRAALSDMGCSDADVVASIAYSKTPEVEAVFLREFGDLGWPCVSTLSDICRDELLFEVEATACLAAETI
jgi:enamine deaminase RidA (YjgF/YER057c/UK114 family)